MAVAFNKFQPFVENIAEGVFNFSSDATSTITVALTNAANPPVTANGVLTDLTTINPANLSTQVCAISGSAQTGGVYKLSITDLVLTASGTVPAFQYVALFDDDAASDQLIGFYNYGSEVNLETSETFTINFDDANGVLTIT